MANAKCDATLHRKKSACNVLYNAWACGLTGADERRVCHWIMNEWMNGWMNAPFSCSVFNVSLLGRRLYTMDLWSCLEDKAPTMRNSRVSAKVRPSLFVQPIHYCSIYFPGWTTLNPFQTTWIEFFASVKLARWRRASVLLMVCCSVTGVAAAMQSVEYCWQAGMTLLRSPARHTNLLRVFLLGPSSSHL